MLAPQRSLRLTNSHPCCPTQTTAIQPYAWIVNKIILAAGTTDPLLRARLEGERKQMERIANGLAKHAYVLPWKTKAPIGFEELLAQTVKMAHDEPNPRP